MFFEVTRDVKECRPDTRLVGGIRVGRLEEGTAKDAESTGAASPSAFVGWIVGVVINTFEDDAAKSLADPETSTQHDDTPTPRLKWLVIIHEP